MLHKLNNTKFLCLGQSDCHLEILVYCRIYLTNHRSKSITNFILLSLYILNSTITILFIYDYNIANCVHFTKLFVKFRTSFIHIWAYTHKLPKLSKLWYNLLHISYIFITSHKVSRFDNLTYIHIEWMIVNDRINADLNF